LKLTLSVSGPWKHMRWMVTSEMPVSGSSPRSRAMLRKAPVSLGVLTTCGMMVLMSNGGLMTTCWQGAAARSTTTGGTGRASASSMSNGRRSRELPKSLAVRSRLARMPATARICEPFSRLNSMAGPILVGGGVGVPDPTRRYTAGNSRYGSTSTSVDTSCPGCSARNWSALRRSSMSDGFSGAPFVPVSSMGSSLSRVTTRLYQNGHSF